MKGLELKWVGTFNNDNYYKERNIADKLGIWSKRTSFKNFLN